MKDDEKTNEERIKSTELSFPKIIVAENNALQSQIVSLAHDFNNMLTVIAGNAQIGLEKYRGDDYAANLFKDINDAAESALALAAKLRLLAGDKQELLAQKSAGESAPDLSRVEASPAAIKITDGEKETILIIDDDKKVLNITERALGGAGYRTISADGGEKGVAIFERHADDINLVVLDIMMPEMDGLEVFNLIRKIRPDIKVVICSGFSMDGMAMEMMEGGAKAFVQKPFKVAHICEVVRQVLDR